MAEPLPKCILLVLCEIDAEVESEWNRWYDAEHLPAALACPGVVRGQRYRSTGDVSLTDHGQRQRAGTVAYTTVYEIEGPEVLETPEFKAMAGWYQFTDRIKARTQVFQQM
jgi:hypothetical protein